MQFKNNFAEKTLLYEIIDHRQNTYIESLESSASIQLISSWKWETRTIHSLQLLKHFFFTKIKDIVIQLTGVVMADKNRWARSAESKVPAFIL